MIASISQYVPVLPQLNGKEVDGFTYHWVIFTVFIAVVGNRQLGLRDQSSPLLADGAPFLMELQFGWQQAWGGLNVASKG